MTSREFNQDTGRAKRATSTGPVYITDRGRPSHVLMTFEDFQRYAAKGASIVELLSQPAGVGDIDFDVSPSPDVAAPVVFD